MSLKQTLIMGAIGAASVVVVRKLSSEIVDGPGTGYTNGKMVPLVPEFAVRNNWSFAWVAMPAIGAWYLSR